MPRIAIVSDIHGNLPALNAVVREIQSEAFDGIACLGDVVGYGASPAECVELIRQIASVCVVGNHEVEIPKVLKRGCTFSDPEWRDCSYQAGLAHAAKSLSAADAQWLSNLPYRARISGAVVAHGSLDRPQAFHYINDLDSARPTLALLHKERAKIGFFGHTHVQGVFTEDPKALVWLDEASVMIPEGVPCVITVGAVGKPHRDPECRAAWVLWNPESRVVEFRKTVYNRTQAARDIMEAGLPMDSSLTLLTSAEIEELLR